MLLRLFHGLLENRYVFELSQRLDSTVQIYKMLLNRHVRTGEKDRVLDIGCGTGAYQCFFSGEYFGVDSNWRYLRRRPGVFLAGMDATRLGFRDGAFTHVVTIAVFHHLPDTAVAAAVAEALRVSGDGSVHVIDAVYPLRPGQWFKRLVFACDRGRHQRTRLQLKAILGRCGDIVAEDAAEGDLHDVVYIRVRRRGAGAQ